MLAPDDTHSHGHVAGSGDPAYVLIMTGDDQRVNVRTEWDSVDRPSTGARCPGTAGRWVDTGDFPAELTSAATCPDRGRCAGVDQRHLHHVRREEPDLQLMAAEHVAHQQVVAAPVLALPRSS